MDGTTKIFSFESHVQLLAIFAIFSPTLFLLTSLVTRGILHFHTVQGWINHLNNDVMHDYLISKREREYDNGYPDQERSATFKVFIATLLYLYYLLSIVLAFHLWHSVKTRCIIRLGLWTLCITILSGAGLTLINPTKSINLLEVGLIVVFVKVSVVYSIYTFIIVLCLIFKIKSECV